MSKITSNFALVLALICAAIKAKFSQPLIYSQDEPQAAYSPTRVFSPKEDEYFQRTLQSSVGQKGTFLTYTNAKLEPFTIGLMMLDLRHLSDFNKSFLLNSQWTVSLNFTGENSQTYCLFGGQFPEPNGFQVSVDVPYFFTFMTLVPGTLNLSLQSTKDFSNQALNFGSVTDLKTIPPNRAIIGENKLFISVMPTALEISFPKYLGIMNITAVNLTSEQTRMPILVSQSWAADDKYQPTNNETSSIKKRRLLDSPKTGELGSSTKGKSSPSDKIGWKSVSQTNNNFDHTETIRMMRRAWAANQMKVNAIIPPSKQSSNDKVSHTRRHLQTSGTTSSTYYGEAILADSDVVLEELKKKETEVIAMTFLPFFSNCEFYGSYIYLPALFEAHPRCSLVPQNDVVPIDNFKFGMQPNADTCEDIIIDCKYSENVTALDSTKTYWFQAKTQANIFSFYLDPVTSEEFSKINAGETSLNSEDLVNVMVMSTQQPNKIPTEVMLNISYYQRDQTTKRLVLATVEYSGFIDPSNYPDAKEFNYTLIVNYLPMGHTALAIAFALPSSVYMVMYIIVGGLAIVMTAVFALYHRIVSRSKDKQIYFMPYLQYAVPPNLIGLAYSLVPVGIYIFFLAIFVTGHILTWRINSLYCKSDDEECLAISLFDYIVDEPYKTVTERKLIQRRRFGYFLVHSGLWMLWRQAELSTVKDSARDLKRKEFTSHDNNIWTPTTVKRMHYFMISLLTILLDIFLIRTSFTQLMSANIWLFVYSFKILGIAVEAVSEYILQDNLLILPISSTLGLMEGLATIAAPDFFEFVYGFIQGLGIQFVERAYWDPVKDMAVDWIIEKYEELQEWFKKIMGEAKEVVKDEEDDEKGLEGEAEKEAKKEEKTIVAGEADDDTKSKKKEFDTGNPSVSDKEEEQGSGAEDNEKGMADSGGSEILLTEESEEYEGMNEYESKMLGKTTSKVATGAATAATSKTGQPKDEANQRNSRRKKSGVKKQSVVNQAESVVPLKELQDISKREDQPLDDRLRMISSKVRSVIDRKQEQPDKFERNVKVMQSLDESKKGKKRAEKQTDTEEYDVNDDDNFGTYSGFANQTVTLYVNFYEETGVSIKWGIKQKDFIFYFLFNTAIIPFQTVIDILFYNLMKHYRELDYIACLKSWKEDFQKNGAVHFWRGFAPIKTEIEGKSRPLDQFSFSSQFYFISYIGTNGFLMIILGVNAVMETTLNVFTDPALPLLLVGNQIILYLIEMLCLFIRRKFKIWETTPPKDNEKSMSEAPADKVDEKSMALSKVTPKSGGPVIDMDALDPKEDDHSSHKLDVSQNQRVPTEPDGANQSQADVKTNMKPRIVQSQMEPDDNRELEELQGKKLPDLMVSSRHKNSVFEPGSMLRRSPTQNSRSDGPNSDQKERSHQNISLSKVDQQVNQSSYHPEKVNPFASMLNVRVGEQELDDPDNEDSPADGKDTARDQEELESLLERYEESLRQLTKKKQQLSSEQQTELWEPISKLRGRFKDPFAKFQGKLEIIGLSKLDEQIEEELRIRRCLEIIQHQKSDTDLFKETFLSKNKNWLQDHVSRIISPNTIYKHRQKLHSTLSSIKTNIEPYKEHQKLRQKKAYMFLDAQEKREFKQSLTPSFMNLLSEWRNRSHRLKQVRAQIAGIFEQLTDPYCKFCGSSWGLKCESIDNIEDVFEKFRVQQLESDYPNGIAPDFTLSRLSPAYDMPQRSKYPALDNKGMPDGSQVTIQSRAQSNTAGRQTQADTVVEFRYRKSDWQRHFVANAVFRTLCYDCHEKIRPKIAQEVHEQAETVADTVKDKAGSQGIVSVLKKPKPFDKVKSALNKIGFTRLAPEIRFKDEVDNEQQRPPSGANDRTKGERFARVAKAVIKRRKEEQAPRGERPEGEVVKVTRFSPNTKFE